MPRWAIVQNPLIYGNQLIVAPQTSQAGVVAYDKLTGELKWKSVPLSGVPGYVSPSIVKVAGEDHLVMITAAVGRGRNARDGSVNGLDPQSGKVLWTYTNWQCIIPVPQPVDAGDGRLLITGGYGAGTAMIRVDKKGEGSYGVTELFKNPDFGAHTQPPILHNDHFYSHYTINERSDGLVAMSMDGQIKWKTGSAASVRARRVDPGRRSAADDGRQHEALPRRSQSLRLQAARQRRGARAGRQLGAAGTRRWQAAGPRSERIEGACKSRNESVLLNGSCRGGDAVQRRQDVRR